MMYANDNVEVNVDFIGATLILDRECASLFGWREKISMPKLWVRIDTRMYLAEYDIISSVAL